MARKSKWVEVKSPQEPVADVAGRALRDRLQLVWRYLHRASQGASTDTENVHQLRVSTRRTVAAIEIFADLLPRRRKHWMAKQVKRIRRAAGTARDLDVMLTRFTPLAEEELGDDQYGLLVHTLRVRRKRAQEPIDDIYEKLEKAHFRRHVKGLIKRVRLRTKHDRFEQPSIADAAQLALQPLVHDFFTTGSADFTDFASLHAFRIQGKHLRYAMEIFAGAFDPSFREGIYPLVAALQDRLGQVNDRAAACELFNAWLAEDIEEALRPVLNNLMAEEQEALEVNRTEFMQWWSQERRDELQNRFAEFGLAPSIEEEAPPELVIRRAE